MTPRRTTRSTRPRWRRSTVLAVGAVVAAAVVGPATAGASWSSYDPELGSDPNGQGSAPDEAASNGSSSWGGGVIAGESTSTIATTNGSCVWTVSGRLIVRNPTVDGVVDGDPVPGITVKVSGRSAVGAIVGEAGYNEWGTVTTNSNGDFSITKPEPECDKRRVKIEAKFEDSRLRVLGPTSPVWYELYDSVQLKSPSLIDVNDEPFGGDSGEQSTTQARTDAQTWIVYRKAIDRLAAIGQPMLQDVTVHNPATFGSDSWADPVFSGGIHIISRDTVSLDTMLHELAHAWGYPRQIGENCLLAAVEADQSTHDQVEQPCVAFNEGFADFFANKLEQLMNTEGDVVSSESNDEDSTTPMTRAELKIHKLASLTSLEMNELGWDQVFRVLTSSDITRQLFGPGYGAVGFVTTYTGPSCAGHGVPTGQADLADALTAFGSSVSQFDLQDSDDPSVYDFFARAADRLPSFDDVDAIAYKNAVDPTLTSEPHEAYGC